MPDGLEDKACLLTTDTGDAGSSPHVARGFFQWCSMTNIAIYIINKMNYGTVVLLHNKISVSHDVRIDIGRMGKDSVA